MRIEAADSGRKHPERVQRSSSSAHFAFDVIDDEGYLVGRVFVPITDDEARSDDQARARAAVEDMVRK